MNLLPTEPPSRAGLFKTLSLGLVAGVLAGLAMLVVMAALRLLFGWPTPTELIFDRLFPKLTVTFFIDSLVRAGGYTPLKLQGVFGALAGQLAVAGLGGVVYAAYLRWLDTRRGPGSWGPGRSVPDPRGWRLIVPGVLFAVAVIAGFLWPTLLTNYAGHPPGTARMLSVLMMLISFGVCGVAIMVFHGLLVSARPPVVPASDSLAYGPDPTGRRRFVALGVGAGLAVVLGGLLRRLFKVGTFAYDGREYYGPKVQKVTPIAPQDEFYQVSKNLVDPKVVRDNWRLDIVGLVENPRVYTFEELTALPAVEQETTLVCISYRVGGGLCSNALWKGVPLPALLAQARPRPGVSTVLFRASDGYYETFKFEKAMEDTTIVAYEMNGQPLPDGHGFPLRMIVPGLYGEKQPKWLTRIELLNEADARLHRRHGCGFYKEQGWGQFGDRIPIHSRFDAPLVTGDHFEKPFKVGVPAELRGMALGGDRGISKVEVSFDDGKSWAEAPITQPGTKISWSLWTLVWTPTADQTGKTRLIVRATDGDGKLQIAEDRNTVPNGATGLHRVNANVGAA